VQQITDGDGRIAAVSAGNDDFAGFVAKFVYFLRRIRPKELRGAPLIPFAPRTRRDSRFASALRRRFCPTQ
jgi:hypothetical protein